MSCSGNPRAPHIAASAGFAAGYYWMMRMSVRRSLRARACRPKFFQLIQIDDIDLFAEPVAIDCHQRVMSSVQRTAQSVFDDDDAKALINRAQCSGQNTHIRLRARKDEGSDLSFNQQGIKCRRSERRVAGFIEDGGRRSKPFKFRD